MSSVSTLEKSKFIKQDYHADWIFEDLEIQNNHCLSTPVFMPIIGSNVGFCFELRQCVKEVEKNIIKNGKNTLTSTEIHFKKVTESDISPEVNLDVIISVKYSDGVLLREFEVYKVCVLRMRSITVLDYLKKNDCRDKEKKLIPTNHNTKTGFNLTCHFVFYGHIPSLANDFRSIQTGKNINNFASDFTFHYLSNVLSDIKFIVGRVTFPAHKAVLAAHSAHFREMFFEETDSESKSESIDMTEYSQDTLKCFLKFLYSGEIEGGSLQIVLDLVELACRFKVPTLAVAVCDVAVSFMTPYTVIKILRASLNHNNEILEEKSMKFIVKYSKQVFDSGDWQELALTHPFINDRLIEYHDQIS